MSLQEVISLESDNTISLGKLNKKTGKTDPKQVEGYYLGFREVDTKLGKSKIHFFQTSKGNIGVWGATDLNRKLEGVAVGTMAKAEFSGMKPTPRGDMRAFKVYQDKSNTIEVDIEASAPADSYANEAAEAVNAEYEAQGEDEDAENDYEAPIAASSGQLTAADRKAKVDALLANKGKQAKK